MGTSQFSSNMAAESTVPKPVLQAGRISRDFVLTGHADDGPWQMARPALIEQSSADAAARPELSTAVRALWSESSLYLAYDCPYTRLTFFDPPQFEHKRFDLDQAGESLWDRDVVEAFIGSDPHQIRHYTEFEVAPTNERLDLMIVNLPQKDFNWNSGFESKVTVDKERKLWRCEVRIPLTALSKVKPTPGARWALNLYRMDKANNAALAWNPTLAPSFHTPERFGILQFGE